MATGQRDVCFTPKSGHEQSPVECPLSANSGHSAMSDICPFYP
jgi:hypothetical protein